MQDVAADGDREPGDAALAPADGERVQKGLGRVLVAAVAGIDDRAVDVAGEQSHRTAVVMAHDQHVRMHGVQGHRRVDQRLALLDGRAADRHVDDVGAEPLAGQLEARLGPGRALEEEIDLRQPLQELKLLLGLTVQIDEAVGPVQQVLDLERLEALDAEEMRLAEGERRVVGHRPAF